MTDKATLSKYLRRVTGDLRDARQRIDELERRASEPLAIVGIGCRYPGGVRSAADLWELLAAGGNPISAFPADRGWPLERLFDPDPEHHGTSYVEESGFLYDAAEFDAEFFGIAPREALATDPQQRLLLEVTWEALEDAGIDPSSLAGTPTGVFAGTMHHGYGQRVIRPDLEAHQGVGSAASVVSGRVAYALGFEGPAVTVDTACSSSLVAMHLAGQALRGGECDLALAGGVTVMSEPTQFVEFSRQRGLAPDGRCKPFAAAADGTGWSEGVGLVLLERLSDAESNGHEVLAVVRGSATNQDGASNGLTAPNGPSQERVIRQALANAGLAANEVDAVEAHGTGTTLGDPIEAGAILATYGQDRDEPLRLGAVKSNLGHAQAAAGVAGVIKMVEALRHEELPRTLHLDQPTPHVDWSAGAVELLAEPEPWERGKRPRRAGVSSFGISGTNAHLILEEAPAPEAVKAETEGERDQGEGGELPVGIGAEGAPIPLPLSTKSLEALREQASRLAAHLREDPELDPLDVGFSLATSRAQLEHRATAIGASREQLLEALDALAAGKPHPAAIQGRATGGKLAFLFSGQGAQRAGMGRELYGFSVFTETLDEICSELDPHLGRSLKDILFADEGSEEAALLDRTEITQPALFALEVALYRQLEHWGLTPDYLLGHSIGELAAAHVAGVFDLPDACRLIAARGTLMGALPEGGAMVAIEASEEEIREDLDELLSVAAVNAPDSLVVSGPEAPALEAMERWKQAGRKATRLRVSHAFHSVLMEPMLEEFTEVAKGISFQAPRIPVLSNLTGEPLTAEQATDPSYWAAQVRGTVRFSAGLQYLQEQGATTMLGLGPERCEPAELIAALANAQANGAPLEWRKLFPRAKRVPLPTYPFQRQRYWLESSSGSGDPSAVGQSAAEHPLLGAAISLPGPAGEEESVLLTGRLSLQSHPWLSDHSVHGTAILPGTGLVEMALRAGEQAGVPEIAELTIEAPLVLPEQGAVQVQVRVDAPDEEGYRALAIHSRLEDPADPGREWMVNATGALGSASGAEPEPLTEWPPAGAEPLAVDSLYERTVALGIDYGPAFQGMKAAWQRGEELFAEAELAAEQGAEAEHFGIHPALLDAALHPAVSRGEDGDDPKVPFAWTGVRLHRSGAAQLRIAMRPNGTDTLALAIADASGEQLATVESLAARPLPTEQLTQAARQDALFEIEWVERERPEGGGEEAEVHRFEADPELDPPAAAAALAAAALEILQAAIAGGEDGRHAFLTEGAVAVAEDETPDPAAAAVWGLVRSAQAEHPGRFQLIDSDGSEASAATLAAVLAPASERQVALRGGRLFVPRLLRAGTGPTEPPPLDPERTVLITGGSGALGALFARHLVSEHGARQLLLTSRRGPDAPGVEELVAELAELGAEARVVACDVAERSQLEELLASIPDEHPLGAVFHAAAIFDNALIGGLDREQLARVLAAKAKAAWDLHELTAEAELTEFVLFSSLAGSFNNPGQGNYAAASAFLDALGQCRQREGLPAAAIAWGLWEREGARTEERLVDADLARLQRAGVLSMPVERGLELFERARSFPFAVAAPLDSVTLRALARSGELAPLFSGLVRMPARRAAADSAALASRLAEAPEAEREEIVVALVAEHAAAVLGHASAADVDPRAPFKDLGFDSLGAVELRNRLVQATGLRLPSTLVFDHPTVAAAAAFVRERVAGMRPPSPAPRRTPAHSEEPIAIVGIACRYPGGVHGAEDLWQLLAAGADPIAPFPGDRGWDLERLYDPDPESEGTSYAREGGFLDDAAGFDAEFFAIGPREAQGLDPQQRLLLEAAWEALEDAGIDPVSLRGSATGVFAGVMHHDYGLGVGGPAGLTGYEGATSGGSVVTGRVAYSLGLEGPAVTVDTACSSSLVAMHLAGQALRSGECDLALAGGVSVSATPGMYVMFSRQRGLAPDGRCKPFAAAADGTGLSEGVGLVLLERLSAAERNGHEVLATIRGSATNQDGASNGLTAPNGPSQERAIRQALANAGLAANEVDAVEAHGTGTMLGDPIEAGAILATYGQDREEPLKLGAVKSNLGHTQAAAGVAGVIKMVEALRHEELPKTLHLDEPTPHVDWSAGAVELLAEAESWERGERTRRAGVSSFGMSGTNAHLILEEAPVPEAVEEETEGERDQGEGGEPPTGIGAEGAPIPLPLSAKSEAALRAQASRFAAHLRERPELDLVDLGFSLATSRAKLEHRATAVGASREELLEALTSLGAGKPHPGVAQGRATGGKLAFLFSGQGAQRPGMGRELYEAFPTFASALDEVCEQFDSLALKTILFAPGGTGQARLLDRTEITQPALFALEVALYRQLEHWGLTPDYLLGHSIGELAAAHVAGVFDLPDACRLIAARGTLMGALPEGGAMVAIEASEEEIREDLDELLSVAAVNAPDSLVVSGPEAPALEAMERWKQAGRKATRLRVSHAFHSVLMEPMLEEFAAVAKGIELSAPSIPVLSNLTGEPLTPEQATDPGYWAAQVRDTVRFAAGLDYLQEQGASTMLGLGPERCEPAELIAALANAQANGASLEWRKLFPRAKRVPLPTYPFQRQRYWLESSSGSGDPSAVGQSAAEHPLLGAAISLPDPTGGEAGWLLTGRLSLQSHPWLADHTVHGTALLPGTGLVEMALRAGEQAGVPEIAELTIEAPLVLPEQGAVQVQVRVEPADEHGQRPLAIHSRPEDPEDPDREWTVNATGALASAASTEPEPLAEWPPAGAEPLAIEALYERTVALGIDYGPAFQGMKAAWQRGGELFAEVELAAEQRTEAERFGLHPALLDAALHPAAAQGEDGEDPKAPFAWSGVRVHSPGAARLRVALEPKGEDTVALTIADAGGEPVAAVDSITARALPLQQLAPSRQGSLFELEWIEQELPGAGDEDVEVARLRVDPQLDSPTAAHALTVAALEILQAAIAGGEDGRHAFLTEGAVAIAEDETPDPAAAAVWGLVRSSQAEHPGRFQLIDSDGSEASEAALAAALGSEEPQLALREGKLFAPRLTRATADTTEPADPEPLDPERTVLITGGSGALGALFARHLVSEHGARQLLLTSRRGPDAPGVEELVAELAELGAEARVLACDASDRSQLEALLASIPDEHPLGSVIHAAGAIDDGLIESLDSERLATVFAPKADAAWSLHELTADLDLQGFVLFSSIAGTFASPGQGNYAAANAFLDALAQRRQSEGLPATAIAWGAWQAESEMGRHLGEADRARFARSGIRPLAPREGLALFDRTRVAAASALLVADLDPAALRAQARAGELAPLLSSLVRVPVRRAVAAEPGSLARRLAAVPEAEREGIVVALVAEHVAAILGHPSAAAIDPRAPFKDLGFDSLGAVELRNRLVAASGLRLPSTLVFDYPTTAAAGAYLYSLTDPAAAAGERVDEAIDRLRAMLAELAGEEREQADTRLRALLSEGYARDSDGDAVERIRAASAEEILEIVNEEMEER